MPELTANGLTLHYDERGDKNAPPMLLVMGVGAQMTLWPDDLLDELAGHGFRVIRFDNRDIGLSQKMEQAKVPNLIWLTIASKVGFIPKVPYSLSDMADDAVGLLDALGIEQAHVVGASMGGMIAQRMAIHHADRMLSLTSVMSTTGDRKLPQADKAAIKALIKRPASTAEDDLVAHGKVIARAIGSPAYPADEQRLHERVAANVRRSVYPSGFVRQMGAIIADGSRRDALKSVGVPTLVLHGEEDPLVPVAHGHDTAAHIPGAKLKTIPGWGHDLPAELIGELAGAIADHAMSANPPVGEPALAD